LTEFGQWRDRASWAALVGSVAGAVTWGGWVTVGQFARPTHDEMGIYVRSSGAYVADKKLILSELSRIEKIETNSRMAQREQLNVIRGNTDAITSLKDTIASMNLAHQDAISQLRSEVAVLNERLARANP
jgi:hypothetical protein